MVVHRRKETGTENLVLFVHGLGGGSYETWGKYPEFNFRDCPTFDVGLIDYESGLRRRLGRSISPEDHARVLANQIRDLDPYENIILVGHSMGGLLCKAAIKELLQSSAQNADGLPAVDKVIGLILFATPQAGSLRVPRFVSIFSKDGRTLRAHSHFVTELARYFQDHVYPDLNSECPPAKTRVPTFAVMGSSDFWVDRLSAGLGLGSNQQKHVLGTHGSIVKPASATDDAYVWFRDRIGRCLNTATAKPVDRTVFSPLNAQMNPLDSLVEKLLRAAEPTLRLHTKALLVESLSAPIQEEEATPKDRDEQ
jgi:hypothetical protein